MTEYQPKVSIGLPVYNGGKYLRDAIESVLSQTFTDFELVIVDNASTDETEEICKEYAKKDKRIRYLRNEKNIGGTNNENLVFQLSKGIYFRLIAHDDIMLKDLLAKSVEVLDNNSKIVLCYSKTASIDAQGNQTGFVYDQDFAQSSKIHERFYSLTQPHDCEAGYSLMRADILKKTELQPNYPESDYGFLSELSLYGQFYQLPEILFYRRGHNEQISAKSVYDKLAYHNHLVENRNSLYSLITFLIYYQWLQFSHYSRIIQRAKLPLSELMLCYFYTVRWLSFRGVQKLRELKRKAFNS